MAPSAQDVVTLRDTLAMPVVTIGEPLLLTPNSNLDRPVRWAHIIGQDRPGHLLDGGELVLSTLPRLTEVRGDLSEALHGYLSDLDHVGAAALAVEVLPDRPRLLEALAEAAEYRSSLPNADQVVPIVLFRKVLRFQAITAELHRVLISRELEADAPIWDPFVSAATNLFDDLAAPGSLPPHEAEDRAVALGMPRDEQYLAAVLRLHSQPSDRQVSMLATLAREAAQSAQHPALVGAGAPGELCMLFATSALRRRQSQRTSKSDPEALIAPVVNGLHHSAAHRRSYEKVPRYTMGVHVHPTAVRDASTALHHAAGIARTALKLTAPRSAATPPSREATRRGYWTAEDLGLAGVLIHLAGNDNLSWFTEHHLPKLKERDLKKTRDLVRAAVAFGGNKANLARALEISRPTLYSRIAHVERLTGKPFHSENVTLLHAALLLVELSEE